MDRVNYTRASSLGLLLSGVCMASLGCTPHTSEPEPQLVWVNSSEQNRSLVRDDQECQIVARQLTADLFPGKPLFRLAAQQNEWDRCFGGRGWRQVDQAAVSAAPRNGAVSPARPDSTRWVAVSHARGGTVYLDTTQIARLPTGLTRIWLLHQNDAVERVGTLLVRRLLRQAEVDCSNRQTRNLLVVAYDDAGATVATERTESSPWSPVVPETIDENIVHVLCPKR